MGVETRFPSALVACAALPHDVKQHTPRRNGFAEHASEEQVETDQLAKPEETATTEEVMTESAETTENEDAHSGSQRPRDVR